MKILPFLLMLALIIVSCDGKKTSEQQETDAEEDEIVEQLADPMQNKGIGPIDEVELGPVDNAMAAEGEKIFQEYCSACHKVEERYIGPPLKEVTARRSPEWIMNMIMNPEQMVKEDPIAKELLKEYLSPMADQNISEEQARKILEYFRTLSEMQEVDS